MAHRPSHHRRLPWTLLDHVWMPRGVRHALHRSVNHLSRQLKASGSLLNTLSAELKRHGARMPQRLWDLGRASLKSRTARTSRTKAARRRASSATRPTSRKAATAPTARPRARR